MSELQSHKFDDVARSRLSWTLLLMRAGIAAVFLMWTIDKFVNPEHAAKVFAKFYKIPGLSETLAYACLLYTSPSPRDRTRSRMPSSA